MPGLFSQDFFPLACFLLPFFISWLLTAFLLRLAPRFRLVDAPGARKIHAQRTPRGGGLAMYVAMGISVLVLPRVREGDALRILTLGLVILLLGLIDDLRPLSWQLRLAVQAGTALAAVLTVPGDAPWGGRIGAVIWIVGLTNAFNMLDNMDALSGGVAWIVAALFALAPLVGAHEGRGSPSGLAYVMLMGAISGFLWFNRPPARIFMGDAGSTFLGFFLGVSSLGEHLENLTAPRRFAVPLCILSVCWYDLVTVVGLRLWQRRSPFHADKQHLSHRLVQLGLKPPAAVCVIYLLTLASGLGGLVLSQLTQTRGTVLVLLQLACWWVAVGALEYVRHYRRN